MKKFFKKVYNCFYGSYIKRFVLWNCLTAYNFINLIFAMALHGVFKNNSMYAICFAFYLPLTIMTGYFAGKYFCKSFQFKKNYNKGRD